MAAPSDTVREYFGLRVAADTVARVSDAARARARACLALGRQKGAAAEKLWRDDHRAEGLRLARESVMVLVEGAQAVGEALGETTANAAGHEGWPMALRGVGASSADVAQARSAVESATQALIPSLESDVVAVHAELYVSLRDAALALTHALSLLTRTPREISWLRRRRTVAGVTLGALSLGALVYAFVPREKRSALASGYLAESPGFPPSRAIDGETNTEWLLPSRTLGWIEVGVSRPRNLRAVRLLNSRNAPYFDHSTRIFRVEAYAGATLLATERGSFDEIERGVPRWQTVPLRAAGVTRVRFVVESYHSVAGGLAEIELE